MIRITTTGASWKDLDQIVKNGDIRAFVIDHSRPDQPALARQYPYTALCMAWDSQNRRGIYITPPYSGTLTLEAL